MANAVEVRISAAIGEFQRQMQDAVKSFSSAAKDMGAGMAPANEAMKATTRAHEGLLGKMREFQGEQRQQGRMARFYANELASVIPATDGVKSGLQELLGVGIEFAAGGLSFGLAIEGAKLLASAIGHSAEKSKEAEEAAKKVLAVWEKSANIRAKLSTGITPEGADEAEMEKARAYYDVLENLKGQVAALRSAQKALVERDPAAAVGSPFLANMDKQVRALQKQIAATEKQVKAAGYEPSQLGQVVSATTSVVAANRDKEIDDANKREEDAERTHQLKMLQEKAKLLPERLRLDAELAARIYEIKHTMPDLTESSREEEIAAARAETAEKKRLIAVQEATRAALVQVGVDQNAARIQQTLAGQQTARWTQAREQIEQLNAQNAKAMAEHTGGPRVQVAGFADDGEQIRARLRAQEDQEIEEAQRKYDKLLLLANGDHALELAALDAFEAEKAAITLGYAQKEADQTAAAIQKSATRSAQLGEQIGSVFSEVIAGTADVGDAVVKAAQLIIQSVVQAAIQQVTANAIAAASGAAVSQAPIPIIGPVLAISAMGAMLSAVMGLLGGLKGRAAGGPVSAGIPYLVGEGGPELIVPGASGTVIPNHALGGGGGTVHVTINALDGASVYRVLTSNPSQVRRGLRELTRSGVL